MKNLAIGVDIGGSHISCAAFDLNSNEYLHETFAENDVDNHAESAVIIDSWGKTIGDTIRKSGVGGIAGIGFAMPGPFDYVHGISLFKGENGKFEKTYGLDVPLELRKCLDLPKEIPVRFINDATAFALGEDWMGSSKDYHRSLAITLGTGFGSAFVRNNLPVVFGKEVPEQGCIWHLPFEDGIADDYFSTRGLIKRYQLATGIIVKGAKEIAVAAQSESEAQNIFDDFGKKLIEFLTPWIKSFGVEILVIGGNISRAFRLFGPAMQKEIANADINLQVKVSELKETAAIIGGARLVKPEFFSGVAPLLAKM